MNVLIADKLSSLAEEGLKSLGMAVTVRPELTADELASQLEDVDILVVRSTKVTAASIKASSRLGLIIRAGSGFNTIDVATASGLGVHVANCPGKNADAVAELAIGLLVAADRRIAFATSDLQSGSWRKKEYGKSKGLKGRTLGLIGFGAIGRSVARRAIGLEMNVMAWSRSLTEEGANACGAELASSPQGMASECDAISIHLPLNDETRHFAGREFLESMKDDAILINTSRGELVDTSVLPELIERKGLRVGLDVFESEPAGGEGEFSQTELARLVTCTPHIGASTDQTSEAIADEVVRIVREYMATGRPPGSVNLAERSSGKQQLVVRHLNQVGVLASVLDGLQQENINVEEMENSIFSGGEAAVCTLQIDGRPSSSLLDNIKSRDAILQVSLS